eukprot:SAG31_NODE_16474_length_708_cov_0.591133_1_plen_183_part_01
MAASAVAPGWALRSLSEPARIVAVELSEGSQATIGRDAAGAAPGAGSPPCPQTDAGRVAATVGQPGRLPLGIRSRAVSRQAATLTAVQGGKLLLRATSAAGPICVVRGARLHALFPTSVEMELLEKDVIVPLGNNLLRMLMSSAPVDLRRGYSKQETEAAGEIVVARQMLAASGMLAFELVRV